MSRRASNTGAPNTGRDSHQRAGARRPSRSRGHRVVAAARRSQRGDHGWTGAGVALVAAFAVILIWWMSTDQADVVADSPDVIPAVPMSTATGRTTPPPWSAPTDVAAAVRAAGLPLLGTEGTGEHLHAHLDVIVNAQPVPIPAGIGIDEPNARISPLHTHDSTGVIHIESPVRAPFSLAQFFTEWQVTLSTTQIGGLSIPAAGGNDVLLRAFLNGRPTTGDPAAIILRDHDEIALIYGAPPHPVPASFSW